MIRFVIFIIAVFTSVNLTASYGKLILINGSIIEGDITKNSDKSYTISTNSGIISFEKEEVRRIIVNKSYPSQKKNILSASSPIKEKSGYQYYTSYDELICSAASKHDIDPSLVKAVIKAESGFNAMEKSNKGACGLMQLMPNTARLLGVRNIYSPYENVHAGTKFLKLMLNQFDGDVELALAAYNAGPGAVKKYGKVPPYRETRNYIRNVYKNEKRWRCWVRQIKCYL